MGAVPTSQVIDQKYQVVRLLGKGGMGAVYEARHLGTGRRVAVKVILNENGLPQHIDVLARFQREARAAGAIESMHITQVLDTGVDPRGGHPYLVMEYLAGEDLNQTLERLGPLPPDLALRIAVQACLGLAKAHEGGVVHRDIKPANIFLARQDAGQIWVKLLDFGIAKAKMEQFASREHAMLTQTGSIVGSPHYMSPEQATGAKTIDPRTDIWSLGVVLYESLAGRTPFAEKDTLGSLIVAICSEPLPPLQQRAPWVPMEVAALVHRALERDPEARFRSVADMVTAMRALLPQGHMVTEEMVAPLPPEARAVIAPTLLLARHPSSGASSPSIRTQALTALPPHGTGPGIETSLPRAPTSSRALRVVPMALGGVLLLVAAGLGLRHVLARPAAPPVAPPALAVAPSLPAASPAPPVTLAPPAESPASDALLLADAGDTARCDPPFTVDGAGHRHPKPQCATTPPLAPAAAPRRNGGPSSGTGGSPPSGNVPASSNPPRPDCNPNFYLDAQGEKRFKPECFTGSGK